MPLCAQYNLMKMKRFLLFLGVALAATLSVSEASAQIKVGEGQVSVALESNNILYMEDPMLAELSSSNKKTQDFGSHDYLKTDYTLGKLSAGIQLEGYLPTISGYEIANYQQRDGKNTYFVGKYIQWEDDNWGVRLGDIYDQFGNGLIFRSYEERALGFNNSLSGARAFYNLNDIISAKVLAGRPRLYDSRSETIVWGGDLSLSLSDMFGWNSTTASIEGSYVGRKIDGVSELSQPHPFNPEVSYKIDSDVLNMVSGRLNLEVAGVTIRGEYVTKLNEDLYAPDQKPSRGNVINLDLGYNYKRFSFSGTFRRQEHMTTPILVKEGGMIGFAQLGGGNVVNYIPLLTRQHTYSLANLNPYTGTTTYTGSEIGGQFDIYYSLRNPKARGKYWNFHTNFSMFNTYEHQALGGGTNTIEGRNVWLDFNFDVERQWNKTVKSTFFYSYQRRDSDQYDTPEAHHSNSHIVVGDVTYKFNKKHSMRFEAQYLFNSDFCGDWVAATVEYNFAPKFSFYVSDMWNCEKMQDGAYGNYYMNINTYEYEHALLHYYQVGASFTHNSFRAQLSYGRNRAGYVCSGGVCRFQPAYTGVNLALTLSF